MATLAIIHDLQMQMNFLLYHPGTQSGYSEGGGHDVTS